MLRRSGHQNQLAHFDSVQHHSIQKTLLCREMGQNRPRNNKYLLKDDSIPFKVFDWNPFRKSGYLTTKQLLHGRHEPKRELCTAKYNSHSIISPCYDKVQDITGFTSRRFPQTAHEMEFDFEGKDKIFSSLWLNSHQIVVGTKCQKLIILDFHSGKQISIPIFQEYDSNNENSMKSYVPNCSGIHSIAMNPSRTLIAIGAGKPNETIQIFKLPTFDLVGLLKGHEDMVFSVNWIDDYTLASGSRDKSLKIWSLQETAIDCIEHALLHPIDVFIPCMSVVEHQEKIRDSIYNASTQNLFTLSADGTVKIWDASIGRVHSSIPLFHTQETVSLGLDPKDHLVAVGSQGHISLIDSRISKIVHAFESLDEGWGVRSLFSHQNLLSIGGGFGRISFYDLRAKNYLFWNTNLDGVQNSLESGKGWIHKDVIYNRHFHGMKVRNAIYTMAYDQEHSRLFTAGGPLQLNLQGSYVGLWQ
jgi:DDB1- and CUL4-associated factor 12